MSDLTARQRGQCVADALAECIAERDALLTKLARSRGWMRHYPQCIFSLPPLNRANVGKAACSCGLDAFLSTLPKEG
jgi:hypothetical protein